VNNNRYHAAAYARDELAIIVKRKGDKCSVDNDSLRAIVHISCSCHAGRLRISSVNRQAAAAAAAAQMMV